MAVPVISNKDPALQGYPLESIDNKYRCGICQWILRAPLQSYCGHRFCRVCLENFICENVDNDLTCMQCREEDLGSECEKLSLDHTYPDNAIRREFNQLQVTCPFCDWSGLFKDFEPHYLSCDQFVVKCSVCSKMVSREECPSHWPCRSVMCPFGCELTLEPANMDQHLKESLVRHLEIVQQNLKKLEDQIGRETVPNVSSIADRIASIETSIQRLGDQPGQVLTARENQSASALPVVGQSVGVASVGASALPMTQMAERTLNVNVEKADVLEGIITIFSRELEKINEQVGAIERQKRLDKDMLDMIDRKAQQLEKSLTLKDASITDIELRVSGVEQASYDGTIVWKIADFQRRRQEAISGRTTSIYSPSFYTSKTGYKMCARIYLNGDGMGKGTHVSLFFVIMRGQYDALLSWPFRQKVTMMLIDQNNREHVIDAFRPDPTSSSFRRPQSEMNIASGCPLFMLLTLLDSPIHAYVKDNVAFVKIIVNIEE